MAASEPSFSDLFRNIIADVQELIRSELRLARAEICEEAGAAKSSATQIAIGVLAGLLALFFALYAGMLALAMVLPAWGAALLVAAVLAFAGSLPLFAGIRRMKRTHFTPDRTLASIKADLRWAKHPTR